MAFHFDERISRQVAEELTHKKLPETSDYCLIFIDNKVVVSEVSGESIVEHEVKDNYTKSYCEPTEEKELSDFESYIAAGGTRSSYFRYYIIGLIPLVLFIVCVVAVSFILHGL